MGIKLPDVAEVRSCGLPFHGLWKDGVITLPNDDTKSCPTPQNGACVFIKVPGQAAVERSEAEATADEEAGLEWRNYGLISGGRYGDTGVLSTSNAATIFYIDSTKKRWLIKIEKESGTTVFFFKVRRFGHIDGTTQSWSDASSFSVTFPGGFNPNLIGSLYTHAQNSNGSEAIFGGNSTLIKITISGDVDLEETGLGLTIGNELIEYYGRLCITRITETTVSGVFTETTVFHYEQRDDATALVTGTYDREVVWTDGTITSDDGEPAPVSGFSWGMISQVDTFSSSKTKTVLSTNAGTKYIGAGYYGDVLKLIGHEYSYAITETTTWSPNYDIYNWIYQHRSTQSVTSLKSKSSSNVIYNQEKTDGPWNNGTGPLGPGRVISPLPEDMLDGYEDTSTLTSVKWEDYTAANGPLTPWEDFAASGVDYKKSVYLTALAELPYGWRNPVFALVTETRPVNNWSSVEYTTHSAHAPSLANQSTSIAIANLYVSWHPVTNQLAIDTVPICWF